MCGPVRRLPGLEQLRSFHFGICVLIIFIQNPWNTRKNWNMQRVMWNCNPRRDNTLYTSQSNTNGWPRVLPQLLLFLCRFFARLFPWAPSNACQISNSSDWIETSTCTVHRSVVSYRMWNYGLMKCTRHTSNIIYIKHKFSFQ